MARILVVGNGGREASMVWKLAEEENNIFAAMTHENPSILEYVISSRGGYRIFQSLKKGNDIAKYAKEQGIELAVVSSDEPLAAGVVDSLFEKGIAAVGPTLEGARIEWDKAYALELSKSILPEFTPEYRIANNEAEVVSALNFFKSQNLEVAVKPQGLTGGKGVKVMGQHLDDYNAAKEYALKVLTQKIGNSKRVIIEEKLDGIEFTVQALTDGVRVFSAPASYDYPFRYDGDKGPGTGGMGSFTSNSLNLPFMTIEHYNDCMKVITEVINKLRHDKKHFTGVLNAGFFVTPAGIRIMEFNARYGDPECMNMMCLIDTSLSELLFSLARGNLDLRRVKFKDNASVVKYLVAPEYSIEKGSKEYCYTLDMEGVRNRGIEVFFSSSIKKDDKYLTVGTSRNVALCALDETPNAAHLRIEDAIEKYFKGPLEHRRDVGSGDYIKKLVKGASWLV